MERLNGGGAEMTVSESRRDDGAVVLALAGELDVSNAAALRGRVDAVLALAPSGIVFDLSDLQFMDSSGIAVLVLAANEVGNVELRDPSSIVRRIVHATGLAEILKMNPP
jgi:anti-anti-sigma factor